MSQKTLYILMSHAITPAQKKDAVTSLGAERFVTVPSEWWGQIPADDVSVCAYTLEVESWLSIHAQRGDYLLVQGDFGATVRLVHFAVSIGMVPIYATTKRIARDVVDGDRVTTVREFQHVRFRHYETKCEQKKSGDRSRSESEETMSNHYQKEEIL
jgi:hypothetical protein